ncbi:hypothetical protein AX769_01055 [Frondihabitans sp. PAMC 28766]|nr:hypothetical protein AX769_01055 [Frondihabitans sp. PAMC 28766]
MTATRPEPHSALQLCQNHVQVEHVHCLLTKVTGLAALDVGLHQSVDNCRGEPPSGSDSTDLLERARAPAGPRSRPEPDEVSASPGSVSSTPP